MAKTKLAIPKDGNNPPAEKPTDGGFDQQDQLDDLLDDMEKEIHGVNPDRPENDEVELDEVDPTLPPEEDEEEEVEEPEEKPEEDEEPTEGEPIEDDLTDLSRSGLTKLIEKDKIEGLDIKDDTSDDEIRDMIREVRAAKEPEQAVEDMRKWMNEQAAEMMQKLTQPATPTEPQPTAQQPQQPQPKVEGKKLEITDDTYRELMESKESFLKYSNDLLEVGEQRSMQRVLPMVNELVQQQFTLYTIVNDFYADNPDLRPYRQIVSFLASQYATKNPDKDYVSVLTEVEKVAREKLRMPRQTPAVTEPENGKPSKVTKPAFPTKNTRGNRRGPKPQKPTGLQAELEEFNAPDEDDPFTGRITN